LAPKNPHSRGLVNGVRQAELGRRTEPPAPPSTLYIGRHTSTASIRLIPLMTIAELGAGFRGFGRFSPCSHTGFYRIGKSLWRLGDFCGYRAVKPSADAAPSCMQIAAKVQSLYVLRNRTDADDPNRGRQLRLICAHCASCKGNRFRLTASCVKATIHKNMNNFVKIIENLMA
jgi:hypothetical protein